MKTNPAPSRAESTQHGLEAHATVGVRLFAAIRDAAGVESMQLSANSVRDVSQQLRQRFPQVEQLLLRCRFAVNQEFASNETQLKSGDEVAVIPPVSGG